MPAAKRARKPAAERKADERAADLRERRANVEQHIINIQNEMSSLRGEMSQREAAIAQLRGEYVAYSRQLGEIPDLAPAVVPEAEETEEAEE